MDENKLQTEEFLRWMEGQTVGALPDGTDDYYEIDVQKFIELKRRILIKNKHVEGLMLFSFFRNN